MRGLRCRGGPLNRRLREDHPSSLPKFSNLACRQPGPLDHVHNRAVIIRNTIAELVLRDSEPHVELGRLPPTTLEVVLRSGGGRNRGPGRLDAPSQVAQPLLRGALVRLPRVVREAARDLQEAELPRRGRDLLCVLAFVRAAERDPRLEPRPRLG